MKRLVVADEGSSVSIPEECTSANPKPKKMKNRSFSRFNVGGPSDHEFFRSSFHEAGFFNVRALLGLTLCFVGLALAIFAARESLLHRMSQPARYMPVPGGNLQDEAARLAELELYWRDRLTYPTGRFDPAWVRVAAAQDARIARGVPAGSYQKRNPGHPSPLGYSTFIALGPQPERMTGCSGCFDYTTTEGRVNAIAVDAAPTVHGSIVAYSGGVG